MVGKSDAGISVTTVDEAGSVATVRETGVDKRGLSDDILVGLVSKLVKLGLLDDILVGLVSKLVELGLSNDILVGLVSKMVELGLLDDIMVGLVSKMVELGITADDSEPVCRACEECIETVDAASGRRVL